jgi:putative chitinase
MAHLLAAGIERRLAALYLDPLNAAAIKFDIVTPIRAAMFLAQIAWESEDFKATEEIWGPTPAQVGYENRADLGNNRPDAGGPGNGRRWAGHGLIQVTGYFNHLAMANYFGIPSDGIVAWLKTPEGGCQSAAMYWFTHGCNELADRGDFVGVTRKINGGTNGLAGRNAIFSVLVKAFGLA